MNILLDTNIVIDAIAKRSAFYEQAKRVLEIIENRKFLPFITAAQYSDILYICHTYIKNEQRTREVIKSFLDFAFVLDVNREDVMKSINYEKNDAEDGLVIACAERHGIDIIITRNAKDFKSNKLIIMSPLEFINFIEKSKDELEM